MKEKIGLRHKDDRGQLLKVLGAQLRSLVEAGSSEGLGAGECAGGGFGGTRNVLLNSAPAPPIR
jgi:hypothetical protein